MLILFKTRFIGLHYAYFCTILHIYINCAIRCRSINQLERIILEVITASRDGAAFSEIMERLSERHIAISRRSVQYRLADLVKQKQIIDSGQGRSKRYYRGDEGSTLNVNSILLTEQAQKAYDYIQQPLTQRKPIGYNDVFLDAYVPNKTSYLTVQDKAYLNQINIHDTQIKDADTYAKNILDRLIIDLSWNSSRLEGNTYSLLDTRPIRTGFFPHGASTIFTTF